MVLLLWGLRFLGRIEVVDSLAVFGARTMLGDAFAQQLLHAFGGGHAHHHHRHHLEENGEHSHSRAHTRQDLSVLFGIIVFLIVEKVVRYAKENPTKEVHDRGHGHHHHYKKKLKDEFENSKELSTHAVDGKTRSLDTTAEEKSLNKESGVNGAEGDHFQHGIHQKRVSATKGEVKDSNAENVAEIKKSFSTESPSSHSQSSLVFGYLSLFSDGDHNFTDGLALGSAFLLHGFVGGWSIALFLLAYELLREVLILSSRMLMFLEYWLMGIHCHQSIVLLPALVALTGTALALVLGNDPGYSSLIEGLMAGGLVLIAVAGVLPDMNNGKTLVDSLSQLLSF